MRKKLLCMAILVISLSYKSQVGIGTATPKSTLDITAKNATGSSTNTDGILIPRVDRQRALSMTSVEPSTLIYVNNISTGTAIGQASNIDAVGFYYFDGSTSKWTKLSTDSNIYNANGSLTGNRTVVQGANTLAFTGTQVNAVSVDGNTLSVDAANNRVGIGTTTPDTKLTINTPDNSFGLNHTNGSVSLKSYIGGGVVSLGTTTANDLRFTTNNTQKMSITSAGNVGIGTSTPDSKLTITAPDNSFGLHHTNGSTSLKSYIGGGVVSLGTTTANDLRFTTNNTQKMSITSAGNVGIGTVTPQKTLHVSGSLQVTNELNVGGDVSTAGSPGIAGQVLKSNGPGAPPTWQNLAGVPSSIGTVIAVNGQFLVAQEIIVQMTSDFTAMPLSQTGNIPAAIGNLNNKIVDNENLYTGTSSSNSFKVSADGVYQITMNAQLSTTDNPNGTPTMPVLGIWDDTINAWVARVNDVYWAGSVPVAGGEPRQTYTLITSIPMVASHIYSFRLGNTREVTVRHLSSGSTGSGPVTQMSVKRLK